MRHAQKIIIECFGTQRLGSMERKTVVTGAASAGATGIELLLSLR
jgi:hypothetical protein